MRYNIVNLILRSGEELLVQVVGNKLLHNYVPISDQLEDYLPIIRRAQAIGISADVLDSFLDVIELGRKNNDNPNATSSKLK